MSAARILSFAKPALLIAVFAGALVAWRRRPVDAQRALVDVGEVRLEASGTGTLESDNRVVVAFTVGGRLASLAVVIFWVALLSYHAARKGRQRSGRLPPPSSMAQFSSSRSCAACGDS